MFKRKKIGLALGAGGARGMAHIGVLKVIEELNIPIDFISGTSMGAVIASLYAANPNAKKLEKDITNIEWKKIFDYTFPKSGLIKGDRIGRILEEKLSKINFGHLKIPLFITAFDLQKKREVIFSKGDVAKAVRASISIPGVFIPVENKDMILVDGGIIDPMPTEILKEMGAEIIIAVNVDFRNEKKPLINQEAILEKNEKKMPGIIDNTSKSLQVISSQACKNDLMWNKADFIININLEEIGTMDFNIDKINKSIKKGEKEARKSLEDLKSITQHPLRSIIEDLQKNLNIKNIKKKIKKEIKQIEEE